jgi:hypothetical protein
MQNLPGHSVTASEKVRCLRNNTPNHTLTDLKARQSSKVREIGNALISTGFVSLMHRPRYLDCPGARPGRSSRLSTKAQGSPQGSSAGC